MVCPKCQGALTLEAGYDIAVLLICKNKLQLKPTCNYAKYLYELPSLLTEAIDNFLSTLELVLETEEHKER